MIFTITSLLCILFSSSFSSVIEPTPKISKHNVLLVVSLDGFANNYFETVEPLPALMSIKSEGVSIPYLLPQFPSKTFPNHQSIVTGLYPESHGIVDNAVYDPILDKNLSGSGAANDPEFWNYRPDVLPFYILNEAAGDSRFSGVYMWPGSASGYGPNNSLLPSHYLLYNESIPWEERVETVISWITDPDKPTNVVFLYHNEPDSSGHFYGTEGEELLIEVKRVDERVKHLTEKLKEKGIYDLINLVIVSDHGMQTIHDTNVINVESVVDADLYFRHGGSPVFNIRPKDENDIPHIYEAFKNDSANRNYSAYLKAEMEHLQYTNSHRIMQIVLIADPGHVFQDVTFNNGIYGMHGFDNRCEEMRAIFIARGPLFRKGHLTSKPFSNVDLFPLFAFIAELDYTEFPNNGSFSNSLEVLRPEFLSSTTTPTDEESTASGIAISTSTDSSSIRITFLSAPICLIWLGFTLLTLF